MVLRHPRSALWLLKSGMFWLALLVLAALIAVVCITLQFGPGSDNTVEAAFAHYDALATNLTARIHTAERALLRLRASQQTTAAPKKDHIERPPERSDEEAQEHDHKLKIRYDESTRTFQRWRSDFKCGANAPPLPDGEMVECNPQGEGPCCSSLGWCGKTNSHCNCDVCQNYRIATKIEVREVRKINSEAECQAVALNLGEQPSPEECAMLLPQSPACSNVFMFSMSQPHWGCRCCDVRDGASAKGTHHPLWALYSIETGKSPAQ